MDRDNAKSGFEIIHKGRKCDPEHKGMSLELSDMIGDQGMSTLLSFLSYGPLPPRRGQPRIADMDEFVDLFRRLQTPGYEEARRHFRNPEVLDAFDGSPEDAAYVPDKLNWIAETGRRETA
ncbi:hypothetical protein MUN78_10120 [Leucobacter allii]|uniref:Uncharacterized protein n=1 Tax=Leucobacter allii TaxID=2932247 RepID=A0ABY4FHD8_9MICO|nr:hypothetical protein [Leucobacter allii]UOQ56059.1 hypothetical protein MUN78_10120 [Leucobacter allii]